MKRWRGDISRIEARLGSVTSVADRAVPMVYYPMDQGVTHANNLDVRVTADPRQIRAEVRRAVGEVDPNLLRRHTPASTNVCCNAFVENVFDLAQSGLSHAQASWNEH